VVELVGGKEGMVLVREKEERREERIYAFAERQNKEKRKFCLGRKKRRSKAGR
jgi:hypothetical protein